MKYAELIELGFSEHEAALRQGYDTVDGFDQINNKIMRDLYMGLLNEMQTQIVCYVMDRTYGWGKEKELIPLAELSDNICRDKSTVSRNVAKLIAANVLIREGQRSEIRYNKYAYTWDFKLIPVRPSVKAKLATIDPPFFAVLEQAGKDRDCCYRQTQSESEFVSTNKLKQDEIASPNKLSLSLQTNSKTDSLYSLDTNILETTEQNIPEFDQNQKPDINPVGTACKQAADSAPPSPPDNPKKPKGIPIESIKQVFIHWQTELNHPRAKLPTSSTYIEKAMKWGYSIEDCIDAINGCKKSEWNMGNNPSRKIYDSLELILRKDKIDSFITANDTEIKEIKHNGPFRSRHEHEWYIAECNERHLRESLARERAARELDKSVVATVGGEVPRGLEPPVPF